MGWPAEWPIPQLLDVWDRAQEEIAAEVPGSVFQVATDSEHNVMLDQPVLVTDAIRGVVDAARQHRASTRLADTGTNLWPLAATAAALMAMGAALVVLGTASGLRRRTAPSDSTHPVTPRRSVGLLDRRGDVTDVVVRREHALDVGEHAVGRR